MVTEMTYQSTGHKMGAVILSGLRSGIIFIPAIFIMSALRGLYGIEEAQPLAYFLSFIPAVIFAVIIFKNMPDEDK